jgi:hypothetical protein
VNIEPLRAEEALREHWRSLTPDQVKHNTLLATGDPEKAWDAWCQKGEEEEARKIDAGSGIEADG